MSALSFSGVVVWLLEKKADASRRRVQPLSLTFLAGSVAFTTVYFINRFFFSRWPAAAAAANLAALAGVFLYLEFKRRLARRRHAQHKPRQLVPHKTSPLPPEAAALFQALEQDPLNAFYHERLSEILEETGNIDKALVAAREASRLDPTVQNKLRVEELVRQICEKKAHPDSWKSLTKP